MVHLVSLVILVSVYRTSSNMCVLHRRCHFHRSSLSYVVIIISQNKGSLRPQWKMKILLLSVEKVAPHLLQWHHKFQKWWVGKTPSDDGSWRWEGGPLWKAAGVGWWILVSSLHLLAKAEKDREAMSLQESQISCLYSSASVVHLFTAVLERGLCGVGAWCMLGVVVIDRRWPNTEKGKMMNCEQMRKHRLEPVDTNCENHSLDNWLCN